MKHAIELLENTVKQENGDEKRIYIGGISMGALGHGTPCRAVPTCSLRQLRSAAAEM
ncbi:MAG: hypothetical protein V8T87_10700 [Victivallales bacterium]